MFRFTVLLFFITISIQAQTVCTLESREKLEGFLAKLAEGNYSGKSANQLNIEIGQWFLETPYVEKTLEIPGPEQLVIDLQGVDCTTYVETVVTLARMAEMKNFGMETFEKELEALRSKRAEPISFIPVRKL